MTTTSEKRRFALNPAAALACAGILCVTAACLASLEACLASLAMGLALLAYSHPPFASLIPLFATVNFFILFMWLIASWTTPGQPVFQLGHLTITDAGIRLCLLASIKANAMLAFFRALLWPFTLAMLAGGLARLRCPAKLIWLFLLMERNAALLEREWRQLYNAARLRGFAPKTNMRTYRTMAAMLAMLFIGAHDRGQRIHEALLLRGFNGSISFLEKTPFARADFCGLGLALLGAAILAATDLIKP